MVRGLEIIAGLFIAIILVFLASLRISKILRIKKNQELGDINKDLKDLLKKGQDK